MMRRGPLDRYSPEWVLRQASAHQVEGSIEFHTERPMTLYLQAGRAYASEAGVDLAEQDLAERPALSEGEAREQTVSLLLDVLSASTGWYFHDPLGHHPIGGSWTWETATLLTDTRARVHETNSLAAWADRTIVLHETTDAGVSIGADAWAVVVALAGSATGTELRTQLDWSPDRVAKALAEIESQGVLKPNALRATTPPPPTDASSPHHTGPLAPPPTTDPSALRRRVLPLRRSTS
jgi:hypothetical protein